MTIVRWPQRRPYNVHTDSDILLTFKNYLLVVINLHIARIAELLLGVQPRFPSGPRGFLSLNLTSLCASQTPPWRFTKQGSCCHGAEE